MAIYKTKSELRFENEFIDTLTKNGWTHVKELDNAEPSLLEDHFREILNQNNRDRLNGIEITDSEMTNIMRFINGMTPLTANEFLTNEFRSVIPLIREDTDLGRVDLMAFWRDDAAGGSMRYEVVKQAIRPGKEDKLDDPNRRFDVTLLFNGMPLIQIEEKRVDISLKQATNQIVKYKSENKYDGLYSMVQIFVALKEDQAKYFANQKSEKMFNDKFFFEWLDQGNNTVRNWKQFTTEFLKIPMAHNVISNYTLVNGQSLVVLRPYQIHAVSAVRKAEANHQNGYVWHATGSGKTMTAFKVATLIQRDPKKQVVFLSDRTELDNQSGKNFTEFAAGSDDKIFETDNTNELIRRFKSNNTGVIITTINKMKIAVERHNHQIEKGQKGSLAKIMNNKRMIFIVDEAHRSNFGEMQRVIRRAFPDANWFGFTGTPIFDFNKTAQDQTTESQFGPLLHQYDIGNALKDSAILPFNTEYVKLVEVTDQKQNEVLESRLSDDMYDGDSDNANKYREKVVHWIFKNWNKKSNKGQFNALFAVSSIKQAIAFYNLFKEVNKTRNPKLKVAISFSLNENGDDNKIQRKALADAMKDYSLQYMDSESTFTLDNVDTYISDVAKRTARMEPQYKLLKPEQSIDLTIVVARLLTGFDAQRLNTLYMDKVMQYQGLIQAYARTNRIYDKNKPQGNIVLFRRPIEMEEKTKDAFEKYAGSGSFKQVIRPDFAQMQEEFKEQVVALKRFVETPEDANQLIAESQEAQIEFLNRFRDLSKKLQYIASYSDFNWSEQEDEYDISEEEFGYYQGAFTNIKESINDDKNPSEEEESLQLSFDFDDVVINALVINREYVMSLATKYMHAEATANNTGDFQDSKRAHLAHDEYRKALETYRKSGKNITADQLETFVDSLDKNDIPKDFDANQEFLAHQYKQKTYAIEEFSEEFGVDYLLLDRANTEYEAIGKITHESEIKNSADIEKAIAHGHKYKNKLSYKGDVSRRMNEFIKEEIAKYRPEGD